MVLIYLAVISLGLFAISRFGFVVASTFLALAIMLLFGERRSRLAGAGLCGNASGHLVSGGTSP